jgi:hypothetical protein
MLLNFRNVWDITLELQNSPLSNVILQLIDYCSLTRHFIVLRLEREALYRSKYNSFTEVFDIRVQELVITSSKYGCGPDR